MILMTKRNSIAFIGYHIHKPDLQRNEKAIFDMREAAQGVKDIRTMHRIQFLPASIKGTFATSIAYTCISLHLSAVGQFNGSHKMADNKELQRDARARYAGCSMGS